MPQNIIQATRSFYKTYLFGSADSYYHHPTRTFWAKDSYSENPSMTEYYDMECNQITGRFGKLVKEEGNVVHIDIERWSA